MGVGEKQQAISIHTLTLRVKIYPGFADGARHISIHTLTLRVT